MNSKCPNELPWNGNVFFVRVFLRITRDNPTRCGRRSRDSPLENHRFPCHGSGAMRGLELEERSRDHGLGGKPWKTQNYVGWWWKIIQNIQSVDDLGWFGDTPISRKPRKPPTHRNSCFLSIIHCCLTKKRWHFSNRNVFITDRKLWISLGKRLRRCGFSMIFPWVFHGFPFGKWSNSGELSSTAADVGRFSGEIIDGEQLPSDVFFWGSSTWNIVCSVPKMLITGSNRECVILKIAIVPLKIEICPCQNIDFPIKNVNFLIRTWKWWFSHQKCWLSH